MFSTDPDSPHGGKRDKTTEYLPLPRTKENPNARGGAIMVQPRAPNFRLDE